VFDVLQIYLPGEQNTKEKYNQLKHHTQKITRQSYWKYIENIVTPKEEEPHTGMKKVLMMFKLFVLFFCILVTGLLFLLEESL
jgi:hypothetical protein